MNRKPGKMRGLIEFQKNQSPDRSIVSGIGTLTQHISGYVHQIPKPLLPTIPSDIKDTMHFLRILKEIDRLPNNSLRVTMDVTSLHPIRGEGILACKIFFTGQKLSETLQKNIIIQFILTYIKFDFNGHHFLQVKGTAMGTKMTLSSANIFMDAVERDMLRSYHLATPPPGLSHIHRLCHLYMYTRRDYKETP